MTAAAADGPAISTIGWLRFSLRFAALVALLIVCLPLYYAWRLLGIANPWPRTFLGGVAWIAGVRTTRRGRPVGRSAVLLANHVSWLDIPALAGASGTAFVAHQGLASVPVLRWLCDMNDTVYVARDQRGSIAEQVGKVQQAIGRGRPLALFPEGTTSDGTGLLPFKSALLSAFEQLPRGVAIQPVLLDYGADAARIAWVGEEHGLDNFKRILARSGRIALTIHFLDPLDGTLLAGRKAIAAAARSALAQTLSERA